MKYYIKTDGNKVIEVTGMPDDDKAPKGYIPVEDDLTGLMSRRLLYKDGKISIDVELETALAKEEKIGEQIGLLQGKLSATDYVVVKIAEGVATEDDYAEVLKDRAKWRAEINELQKEI